MRDTRRSPTTACSRCRACSRPGSRGPRTSKSPPARQATSMDSRAVRVSALDEYDARPERQDPATGLVHVVERADRHLGQDLGFGNVRRDDVRERQERRAAPRPRPRRAAGRLPSRSSPDRRRSRRRPRRPIAPSTAATIAAFASIPILTASAPMSLDHRLDLRDHQRRADGLPAADTERVLRGDRGDRAGAVDAERRERLEVRLDAGAAAGVAARDCQCCMHTVKFAANVCSNRSRGRVSDCPRHADRRRRRWIAPSRSPPSCSSPR